MAIHGPIDEENGLQGEIGGIPVIPFEAPLESDLVDLTSNTAATFVRSGAIFVQNALGTLNSFGVDTPGFGPDGLFCDGPGTNLITESDYRDATNWPLQQTANTRDKTGIDGAANAACELDDTSATIAQVTYVQFIIPDNNNPVTHSIFVEKDTDQTRFPRITLQLVGGTLVQHAVDFNTETGESLDIGVGGTSHLSDAITHRGVCLTVMNNGSGNTIARLRIQPANSSSLGVPDATLTGSINVDWAQAEPDKKFCSSPIVGGASRATQEGTAGGNGASWALADLNPDVLSALSNEGTISCTIRPRFNYDVVDPGSYGIATFNDDATSGIFFDGSGNISISDGTNTVSALTEWQDGDEIEIQASWSGTELSIQTIVNSGVPTSATGVFDGEIPSNTHLRLAFGNVYPFFTRDLKILSEAI